MPKYHPTLFISDCWSSIGDITFYHRNGQCYYKRKPYTQFRGTSAQVDQVQIHHRAILAWQRLQHSVQLEWREFAKYVPSHRPPYDTKHHISGYNLFVSAYHGFAKLGQERTPSPQPFPKFPTATIDHQELFLLSDTTTPTFILRCRLTLADTDQPNRWHLVASVQLVPQGVGRNPGLMRSYIASVSDCINISPLSSIQVASFTISASKITGRSQAYVRYRLLDSVTGYRNNWISNKIDTVIISQ